MKDIILRSITYIRDSSRRVGLFTISVGAILLTYFAFQQLDGVLDAAKAGVMRDMTISIECKSNGAKGAVAALSQKELCELVKERLISDYAKVKIDQNGATQKLTIEAQWQSANHIKGTMKISDKAGENKIFDSEAFTVDTVNPQSTARSLIRSLLKNLRFN